MSDIPNDICEKAAAALAQFPDSRVKTNLGVVIARALLAERLATEKRVREEGGHPLTARELADAFGCVWNSALGTAHRQEAGFEFASILAEAFASMSARLDEIADTVEGRK